MQLVMQDLAEMCGFDFVATTFPELFYFVFLATCGTAILASIIKVLWYVTFNTRRLAK